MLQVLYVYCYLFVHKALNYMLSCYLILTATLGGRYRDTYPHFTDEEMKTSEI